MEEVLNQDRMFPFCDVCVLSLGPPATHPYLFHLICFGSPSFDLDLCLDLLTYFLVFEVEIEIFIICIILLADFNFDLS